MATIGFYLLLTIVLPLIFTIRGCVIKSNAKNEPLILTSFLYSVNTNVTDIRCLSEVKPLENLLNYSTYSGFFTVEPKYNSNVFFWFIPASMKNGSENAPLILWVGSGNGISGMITALGQIGPFQVTEDGQHLESNPNSWASFANLLFIDAPVGTGYSFTENELGYVRNSADVATQLFSALMQFHKVFPSYLASDLYLAAESFASRYVATLAYRIYYENPYLECPISLKGLITLTPEIDYGYFINVSSQLFDLGLLNEAEMAVFMKHETNVQNLINSGNFGLAMSAFSSLILGDLWPRATIYQTLTGLLSYKNIQQPYNDYEFRNIYSFLNGSYAKQIFHVGNITFKMYSKVVQMDYDDVMFSYTPYVEDLLNKGYRWLMAVGQFGLLVNPPDFDKYVRNLNWKSTDNYIYAQRTLWTSNVTDQVTAYITSNNNLVLATVLSAGQLIAADQPIVMAQIAKTFVAGATF